MHRVMERAGGVLALVCAALLSCGCHVQLTGQRVSMHYDEARDELRFLIFYDGVHCPDEKHLDKAQQELRDFVRKESFSLLAWPLTFDLASIREAAIDERTAPAARALARLAAEAVRLEALGRYRDLDGRVGAGQLVVVSQAKKLLGLVNAALSEAVLAGTREASRPRDWPHTTERWTAAAQAGHQWVGIEGHALRVCLPVQPGEWDRNKGRGLLELLGELKQTDPRPDETDAQRREHDRRERSDLEYGVQALTAAPISLLQRHGEVTLILGDPKRPCTFRLGKGDTYRPNLEATLAELAPVQLDRALARHILQARPPSTRTALGDLVAWGPPEMQVMALLGSFERKDPADRARKALVEFARRWNREQGFPEAPADIADAQALPKAWEAWRRRMQRYPLPDRKEPAAPDQAEETKPPAPPDD